MTLKTSLFNKGIYKSTLRRYAWGSILYFILLFLCTGMMIFLNEDPEYAYNTGIYGRAAKLLSGEYMVIPMLLSIAVPTVVGLMIFRYIHSKKTSIFVHSLPVKKKANYISSVLAALTLMAVPIILNSIILAIMSLTAYSLHFTVGDCLTWMLLNLMSIFVTFSCVCFVSSITGNSFAMVGLNVIFHIIGLVFAATFSVFADVFLYGFAGEGELIDKVFNISFITRIPTIMTNWAYVREEVFAGYVKDIIIFTIVAVLLYIIGGILYSKRRMETAEDVAGFKCLNHIFKYLVTFMGAVVTFAIFSFSVYKNPFVLFVAVFIVSAVIYFGSEMLLKKTLRVWKSYKGYIVFVVVFSLLTAFCAFTSFFGFETYIPENEEIESVAVYDYYNREKPSVEDADVIAKTQIIHEKLSERRTVLADRVFEIRIHLEYRLENGKNVHRVYAITDDELHAIKDSLYKNENFKKASERIFTPMDSVYKVELSGSDRHVEIELEKEKLAELIECVRADMLSLNYNRINNGGWGISLQVNYIPKELPVYNSEGEQITAVPYIYDAEDENLRIEYISCGINQNFERTMNWLSENGYKQALSVKDTQNIYIVPNSSTDEFYAGEKYVSASAVEHIKVDNEEDKKTLIDYINNAKPEYIPTNERFYVYRATSIEVGDYSLLSIITKEEISTLLPSYEFTKE